uniref:Uncharacterized protein MANES_13G040600 n=1 Tax=Rhizophora mucronata TaxID=61149 RepID=A0A2P2JJ10_RHIMU
MEHWRKLGLVSSFFNFFLFLSFCLKTVSNDCKMVWQHRFYIPRADLAWIVGNFSFLVLLLFCSLFCHYMLSSDPGTSHACSMITCSVNCNGIEFFL